jgi:outer membrane lipopolysaccharide assembly protein LptE/RlpB
MVCSSRMLCITMLLLLLLPLLLPGCGYHQ